MISREDDISLTSFRDPAGYVFREDGVCKRAITALGAADYRLLMTSGLYQRLVTEGLLVAHEERSAPQNSSMAMILIPEQIRFISYPYEWSFGQLRDAALLTLQIQDLAMQHGMSLKDATAFNVQFRGSQPVFIDTLSFEQNDGGPWVAYNQFCRHFLAPLLLMSYVSPSFNRFWKAELDGFPLDLASSLIPKRTYLKFSVLLHIHLHAKMQRKYSEPSTTAPVKTTAITSAAERKTHLVSSLRSTVHSIKLGRFQTEWKDYYEKASHYSDAAEQSKKKWVEQVLDRISPRILYDLGGNVGVYSRLAASRGAYTVCFDIDPLCVHANYERARDEQNANLLPLLQDLGNPSPGLGFALKERGGFLDRGPADMVMALALLHHLRITGNVPLIRIAALLSQLGESLLLEYVPKTDIMARALLRSRKDTFFDYTDDGFKEAFQTHFEIVQSFPVAETDRTLFLFRTV